MARRKSYEGEGSEQGGQVGEEEKVGEEPSRRENKPDPDFDPASIPDPRGKQPQPEGEVPAGSNEPAGQAPSDVTRNPKVEE